MSGGPTLASIRWMNQKPFSVSGRWLARLLAAAALLAAGTAAIAGGGPVVAAAADLQFALPVLAKAFEADTGLALRLVFGSSGNFARQIEQGAPFELFLSADEALIARLAEAGLTRDSGQVYALGRLALFVPVASPLAENPSLDGLAALLRRGRLRRFAIPNPEHAPYGQRAEQLLRARGMWSLLRDFLVLGENAAQAAQFALAGGAAGGISAWPLAHAPGLEKQGKVVLLPPTDYLPLVQRMVLLRNAGETARLFRDFLLRANAQATLEQYGFLAPARP